MAPNPTNETAPLLGAPGTKVSCGTGLKTEAPAGSSCSAPCRFLPLVTVEPALFLMSLGVGMELIFKTNMLVDKTCEVQLHYSDDVCRDLDSGNYKEQQDATQRLTANYNLYCQLIEMLPGAVITLWLGAWSDTRGRRLPVLVPLAGATLKALGLCGNAYWWSLPPWYIMLSYIPAGLGGGIMAIFMASFAYVSDSSSRRSRTTRISIASMTLFVAIPLGNVVGAVLFAHGGYVVVFGMEFVTCFLGLAYAMLRLQNIVPESAVPTAERRTSPLSKLGRSLGVVARRRTAGVRSCILGHVSCIALYMISYGTFSFMLLFTRKKFSWTYKQYTVWSTLTSVFSTVVSCVVLPFLSLRLGMEDSLLGFVGAASHAFFGIMVGTAPDAFFLYVAVFLSSAGGVTISSSRGALSKLVAPDELGAVFSVVGLFESLAPAITSPLFTLVYDSTLDLYPGTVFLIGGALSLIVCCIYTWLATAFPAAASPVSTKQEKADHLPA